MSFGLPLSSPGFQCASKLLFRCAAVLFCAVASSGAALVNVGWNFDSGGTSSPYVPSSTSANVSSASLAAATPSGGSNARLTSGGNPNGYLLFSGTPAQVNGSTLTFTITAGSASLVFSTFTFNYLRSSALGSPAAIAWSYSINGGTPVSLSGSVLSGSGSWGSSVNLNLLNATVPANQTLTLVGLMTGGSGLTSGNIGFDNFGFSGTEAIPEPVNVALGIFGLGAFGIFLRRCFLRMSNARPPNPR